MFGIVGVLSVGKYEPLRHLEQYPDAVTLTFAQIKKLVGELPPSARRRRPWWGNDPTHVQADAWLDLGREVTGVDLDGEVVSFGPSRAGRDNRERSRDK